MLKNNIYSKTLSINRMLHTALQNFIHKDETITTKNMRILNEVN